MEDLLCLGDVDGQGVAGVKVECKEESREVEVTPEVVDKLISSNAQLSQAVAQLCNKFDQMGHMQNMVWSRPVPTIGKFSGRVRRASELDDWVEDATEKIKQLGLQGSEGVSYLCGFLEGPARRRVRNSTVKIVSDLFDCLRSAFGPELNYTDLEKQLHARVQQPGEGVWEFADSLGVIVDKMYKVSEAERIVKEEAELVSGKKPERVVRSTLSSPSCSLCGQHGHLGYQCERFKELVSKTAGNGSP
ncbi:uncharacterized protein LOC135109602 [Scylla paramamosain]|uniref:uncharacterized protein LOC135109602 n=1 Tax=Scylla paramamosain TaxID=85552 RepID=UPI003082B039